MDEKVVFTALIETYGKLLTEKQREIAELYFSCDLSYAEIAEIKGVSRQTVVDAVKTVKVELTDYEAKLRLCEIKSAIREIKNGQNKTALKRLTEIIEE